jgi:hypothetical protein
VRQRDIELIIQRETLSLAQMNHERVSPPARHSAATGARFLLNGLVVGGDMHRFANGERMYLVFGVERGF